MPRTKETGVKCNCIHAEGQPHLADRQGPHHWSGCPLRVLPTSKESGIPPMAKSVIRRLWAVRHRGEWERYFLRGSIRDARLWLSIFEERPE
jgi:hypothetical protein